MDINFRKVDWVTQEYYDRGLSLYSRNKRLIKNTIRGFIADDGSIDGTKMESDWFPLIEADIFISHSHVDREKATCLAGYLNITFGIKSFVDSCIWGNADSLLKLIDEDKCMDEERRYYDYNKRNSSTSHVHMMLSAAILKMIDKTECLFFLKTPNSLSTTTSKIISETESPWLYSEILISSLIRKRSLAEHRPELMKARYFAKGGGTLNESVFAMRHEVYTGHLTDIDETYLDIWLANNGYLFHDKYALDGLYEIC